MTKINACNPLDFQWSRSRAMYDYDDLFDDKISAGEHYYRLAIGGSRSNAVKLSRRSMDRFLFALFALGPQWEKEAQQAVDDRMDQARRIIDKLRPR